MSNILETFPKGSGHKILNSDGTALAQENNLQIVGFDITDEAGDKATKVAPANLNADSLADVTSGNIRTEIVTPATNYSTNEQIIGRWIDGKPLYQKTFQFDNMVIDGTQQNFGSLSGLNIGSYAEVVRSTLNEDNYWTNPGILCVWIRVPQNNFGVKMIDGNSRHGSLYFTIQYTKTTD